MKNLFQRARVYLNKALSILSSSFSHHSPGVKQVTPSPTSLMMLCHRDGFKSCKPACHKSFYFFWQGISRNTDKSNPVKQIWNISSHKQYTHSGPVEQYINILILFANAGINLSHPLWSNPADDCFIFSDKWLLRLIRHSLNSIKHGAFLTTRLIPEKSPNRNSMKITSNFLIAPVVCACQHQVCSTL